MSDAKKLFEPIKVGTLSLKSRIIMSAMVTNFAAEDGSVTDRLIDYHVNIARGGCALNTTGSSYVSQEGKRILCGTGAHDDRLIPGYRRLTGAVHAAGGRISIQLSHGGRECSPKITGLQAIGATVAASRYEGVAQGIEIPREMTLEDIESLIAKFGDAAGRAREGGFDAVEIHAGHGYVITQFLSPHTNKRSDRYGGDIVGRSNFLIEIIRDVKKKAGADFPVLVKLNVCDYVEEGTVPDDARVTAALAEKAGADAIVASVGLHESRPQRIVPAMSLPPFPNIHLSATIKEAVTVPVAAIGRIVEPLGAARVLEEGKADLVALGRPLLCDPEWPRKAQEGKFEDIRQCIGCNQGCIDMLRRQKPITCLQNAEVGREREFRIERATKPKGVAVIGGGPGGLEAARVAALRGHRVTIYEKAGELGGQVRTGRIPPHRGELGKVTDHLLRQVEKLGVSISTGREMTPTKCRLLGADAVVVAVGALPLKPKIKGIDRKHVAYAVDVLQGKAAVGRRIVVVGAGLVGLETADFCIEKGAQVTILEMLGVMAADTGGANRVYFEDRLKEKRVAVHLDAVVTEIGERDVAYVQHGSAGKIADVDTVILATGAVPDDALWKALKEEGADVFPVGDCVKARNVLEAVFEGAKIAREI